MPAANDGFLTIRNLSKTYTFSRTGQDFKVVDGLDLTVAKGEFIAIVGPSGCGKSTLLKMVAGIHAPTEGEVTVAGRKVTKPGPDRAMVFQQYVLFPWKTVRGNLKFGMRATGVPASEQDDRVEELLQRVGLTGFADRYTSELSGGMQQRCALARALAVDPDVLLMDEPLAAVDAQTRLLLQQELLEIWGQEKPQDSRKAVIYITHDIEEAVYLADRILVMSKRPGTIKALMVSNIPRPRLFETRATEEFGEMVVTIWDLIREETPEFV